MTKRMVIMLLIVGLLFGGIFGFQIFKAQKIKKFMAANKAPPATVTTTTADFQSWQPQLNAVGSLRAVRGVDMTTEIAGVVRSLHFKSGDNIQEGQLLVQLNADSDVAQLRALEAAAELAATVYQRDQAQYAVQAISKATLDSAAADLKSKKAQVDQQAALVAKKAIRAPFAGWLGISTVNPGQYMNPGDKIVTLQSIDPIYVDFSLPQQQLSRITIGQKVTAVTDTYPGQIFTGKTNAIDPKVDSNTRNVQIEAVVGNPKRELLPGMFASVNIDAGGVQRYLTLPQTAVSFNPYGATVYIVQETGKSADGKPILTAKQSFVNTGATRGDQVAILSGVKAGDIVVTSGQLKLKNGAEIIINNKVQPSNDPAPKPIDQ
ncbi:MAG TPA: efflux RND transporter periplasmic adaptor subunit [Acidiferrobacterales bacterium]|nr:efflux RND transporter periplasmic adaptor subunit [Acidiferrobacterales bacterium]